MAVRASERRRGAVSPLDYPGAPRSPADEALAGPLPLRGGVLYLWQGLRAAMRQPGVLALLLLYSFLSALLVALPYYSSALEHLSPIAGFAGEGPLNLSFSAPRWLLDEWARLDGSLQRTTAHGMAPLLLLASLSGLLITGGWMSVALRGREGAGMAAFLQGAGRYFFRFLRTWILGLALYAGVTWLVWRAPGEWVLARLVPGGELELAASETRALWIENGRLILYVALLFLVELVLDLGRASLVIGDRHSALFALVRGLGFLLYEPVRVAGVVLVGWILEALWIAALVALSHTLAAPVWPLVLVLPLGRIILRGARYGGLAALYAAARSSRRARRHAPAPFVDGTAWAEGA